MATSTDQAVLSDGVIVEFPDGTIRAHMTITVKNDEALLRHHADRKSTGRDVNLSESFLGGRSRYTVDYVERGVWVSVIAANPQEPVA